MSELIKFDENNIDHLAELDKQVREGDESAKIIKPTFNHEDVKL